jgi:DNA topoisomerase-2
MTELSEDEIKLLKKRVYDMAGVLPYTVKVYLNDKKLPITNFSNYVNMYLEKEAVKITEKCKSSIRYIYIYTVYCPSHG